MDWMPLDDRERCLRARSQNSGYRDLIAPETERRVPQQPEQSLRNHGLGRQRRDRRKAFGEAIILDQTTELAIDNMVPGGRGKLWTRLVCHAVEYGAAYFKAHFNQLFLRFGIRNGINRAMLATMFAGGSYVSRATLRNPNPY
jgi:hypothetical protein